LALRLASQEESNVQLERKRSKDCCSGKTVCKYKLDSTIDDPLIDHILRLDTFDYNNPDGHFLLIDQWGKKRISGAIGGSSFRVVLIQDNLAFISSFENQLREFSPQRL
jgi:hypothetical protein